MRNEFVLAFNEVLEEKQLPKEVILRALESAMISAYRRAVNASNAQHVEAKIDLDTGKVTILAEKEVVEAVQDNRTEVTVVDAQRVNPEAEIGSMVVVESTPRDFGRVAAQTARQVIQQRIRDAERQAQLAHYEKQVGEIISGVVQAVNASGLTIGLEMRAEGSMPRKEMITGERFRVHDRVRALVAEAKDTPRGPQIILSRTHRNFLRRLLENEVPEIFHGIVEIRSIAREPGERAKVAVSAMQAGIDPVGACVGIRGVRIQAIVRELNDEKIDVIEWNPDPAIYIAKALSPARVLGVYLNERGGAGKTATVVVPEDQLSLAIGRDGQNARLAAKLTSWRIDIKSVAEAAADTLHRLQTDALLAEVATSEANLMTQITEILAKKAENRPLTPEEYDRMSQFVDRVEKRVNVRRVPERKAEDEHTSSLRKLLPAAAFKADILDSPLSEHVAYTLQEAGMPTIGDVLLQMHADQDEILKLQGVGPRAMADIQRLMEIYPLAKPTEEAPAAQVEQPVAAAEPEVEAELLEQPEAVEETSDDETETVVSAGATTEEEDVSFDQLFTLRPEVATEPATEEEEDDGKGKKKGKKKSKHVEVVYDPERDLTVAKKKHKRGGVDWDWDS